jgi:hypothetical protein
VTFVAGAVPFVAGIVPFVAGTVTFWPPAAGTEQSVRLYTFRADVASRTSFNVRLEWLSAKGAELEPSGYSLRFSSLSLRRVFEFQLKEKYMRECPCGFCCSEGFHYAIEIVSYHDLIKPLEVSLSLSAKLKILGSKAASFTTGGNSFLMFGSLSLHCIVYSS